MKPHKFDTLSFVSGLIFTGFGLMFLIPRGTDDLFEVFVDVGSWAWPLVLLGIGLAIIVPVFLNRDEESEEPESDQVV
jgi:formate-dependent nitrite reductase membrane component NrfD